MNAEEVWYGFASLVEQQAGAHRESLKCEGISPQAARILAMLDEPKGFGQLHTELDCTPSYLSNMLTRLEEKGLVKVEPAPTDGRCRQVSRTNCGSAMQCKLRSAPPKGWDLSDEEIIQMQNILQKYHQCDA